MAYSNGTNSRQSEEKEIVDNSLAIAKPSDLLFKPQFVEATLALKHFKRRLAKETEEWRSTQSVGPEVSPEDDVKYLKTLDPVEWKEQDHYAVMGIQHLRIRATDEDIKKYYRLRVLRHHPDKRQAAGEAVNKESDYFACIVKAYEVLGNQPNRRAYDSVDPKFDNYVPPKKVASPKEFFKVYGDWFALNSRWSTKEPVPLLGNMRTPRQKVDDFYSFWYEFDSWREYSYLDEEDKEKGQYREERKWIEKQNKQARAKLKKEEMSRIRQVVDNAYAIDPRITMFRDQDVQEKLAKKTARQNAVRQKQEEEQRVREEAELKAKLQKEKTEAEERVRDLAIKKEKEAVKKALKKERKNFRTLCKNFNYFAETSEDEISNMAKVERLCDTLPVETLEDMCKKFSELGLKESRDLFDSKINELDAKIAMEKKQTVNVGPKSNGVAQGNEDGSEWSSDDLALLIKAVNLFPAGTAKRWEVVANFLFQHSKQEPKKQRSAKEVLAKAKDIQGSDFSKNFMKQEANNKAFDLFEKSKKSVPVESEATQADDVKDPSKGDAAVPDASKIWTPEEQKLLEQALKTYSSALTDRWDRIASCVPSRSKKECMARFKELAALVKAKKSAQTAVKK